MVCTEPRSPVLRIANAVLKLVCAHHVDEHLVEGRAAEIAFRDPVFHPLTWVNRVMLLFIPFS